MALGLALFFCLLLLLQLEVGWDEFERGERAVGLGAGVRGGAEGYDDEALALERAAGQLADRLLRVGRDANVVEALGREA